MWVPDNYSAEPQRRQESGCHCRRYSAQKVAFDLTAESAPNLESTSVERKLRGIE